jgi:polyisoprenyl-teichoic acid--peptidoglycan teichoic acid transferase
MTVSLPDRGDGSRRRRRKERKRSTGRSVGRVLAVLATVAVVAALVWVIVDLVRDDDGGPVAGGSGQDGDDAVGESAGPSLIVLTDADGDPYGVTVLVPSASTILHVPPGTLVEVPSLGLTSLRDATRDGGVDLLRHSLENTIGVTFAAAVTLGPTELASAVSSVPPLTIDLDEPVEERSASGRVNVVLPAGEQTLEPDDAVAFLSIVGSGTSLDRLVRHQAFWTSYLSVIGDDAPDAFGPVAAAVESLAGARVRHSVLPVEAVSGVAGDDELYQIDDDGLSTMVKTLFGVELERIRVQVLNGVGEPGVAQRVQPLLVDVGGSVTLSGNADRFDYATTQVVYYDDETREAAEAIRDALGVGELVKSLTGLDVVDVTVVVGADFVTAHPGG